MPGTLRVAALLRVSTTSVEQEESPENQLAYIREEIRRRQGGDEIWLDSGLVYEDELTGALVLERPGVKRLLADVATRKVDVVAMKGMRSLGRDTLGMLVLKRRLWDDMGVDLVSLQDGYRASRDPELIFLIHADRAQHGREEISRNVRTAMRQKALRGQWTCGMVPFGYRRAGRNQIEADPQTAPVAQEIFRLRAEGWGVTSIVDYLNNTLKVPAPQWWYRWGQRREKLEEMAKVDDRWAVRYEALRKQFESHRPVWQPRPIYRMFGNTAYIGELQYYRSYWRRVTGGKTKLIERPDSEHIVIPCPPLVERSLWDRVQDAGRRRLARKEPRIFDRYLFTGLVYCGACGTKVNGGVTYHRSKSGERKAYYYYICLRRRDSRACRGRMISAIKLEHAVLGGLQDYLLALETDAPAVSQNKVTDQATADVRRLEAELVDLQDQRRYYRNEHRLGRVRDSELDEELRRITAAEKRARDQLARVKASASGDDERGELRKRILASYERYLRSETSDRQALRQLLVAAVERIVISEETIDVVLRLPNV